jgi:hypothetical protein
MIYEDDDTYKAIVRAIRARFGYHVAELESKSVIDRHLRLLNTV